jgi:ATP-binding cassette subfamily G (WHITE) protein 2 (PDR)
MASEPLEVERPETGSLAITESSSASPSDDGRDKLDRIETSVSVRERRELQHIRASDREELIRLATLGREQSYVTNTPAADGLERVDTLAGIEPGDPVLDPTSPQFDLYKWMRMLVIMLPT